MNKIITISRQFGSGGHEIGKRLAEKLNIPFYDKSILQLVEENSSYSVSYLKENEEQVPSLLNGPYYGSGHTSFYPQITTDKVFFSISKVLQKIAEKGPCVIVGRCADYVLQDLKPINFFVYAPLDAKVKRKLDLSKMDLEESLSYEDMKKRVLFVDKQRAKYYEFYTDQKWGIPANYHLCLNTGELEIDEAVEILYHYIQTLYNN